MTVRSDAGIRAPLSPLLSVLLVCLLRLSLTVYALATPSAPFDRPLISHGAPSPSSASRASRRGRHSALAASSSSLTTDANAIDSESDDASSSPPSPPEEIFEQFAQFLIWHQTTMIEHLERADGAGVAFSRDGWGAFAEDGENHDNTKSGGITRVLQGGRVVEKGACSLTVIRGGILTAERAATIRGRQEGVVGEETVAVREGDTYSAAALSVVLHTRNPFVPTFRSDVRIFLVGSAEDDGTSAWFGGGSDLTPYYLVDRDISDFHAHLKGTCDEHFPAGTYRHMKRACDEYFYLPARSEHRGTGGIFFDDLPATRATAGFVRAVARGWLPSWLPIVARNAAREHTAAEKRWQRLRRGRYLEFNLLYDRGVKFGLANANPRVEGVMVSAPPEIAFEYGHVPEEGSEEERLVRVLREPRDWV